jgi:undecaprenyl-diphosphatase
MGLAQAAAILPGISRSGATIGAGYFCGLKRAEAVRFAFLMGIPTIGGAIVLKLKEGVETLPAAPLAAGLAVCFVVSLASLKLLEKLAARGKLLVFSIWCIAVGVAGGVIFFLKERA